MRTGIFISQVSLLALNFRALLFANGIDASVKIIKMFVGDYIPVTLCLSE